MVLLLVRFLTVIVVNSHAGVTLLLSPQRQSLGLLWDMVVVSLLMLAVQTLVYHYSSADILSWMRPCWSFPHAFYSLVTYYSLVNKYLYIGVHPTVFVLNCSCLVTIRYVMLN